MLKAPITNHMDTKEIVRPRLELVLSSVPCEDYS